MARTYIVSLSFLSLIILFGCGTSNPTVASIGNEKLTLTDYEDAYLKSNNGWDSCAHSSLADREKFLDLIVKFRLKVMDARDRGLAKDSSLSNELETYRLSVAQSYLLDEEINNPGIRRIYDRKKEEIRASHIFFRLSPNAAPADTLKAYGRAMNVIEQLASHPFDSLARSISEDPSVKSNHGDLGFFTSGKMVPEFENACYSMKAGEYTRIPVRSRYGYHVIKVTVRRPNSGTVRISHILLPFGEPSKDTAAIQDTAWMLYRLLGGGANFKELAKKYSKDTRNAMNNGDLGFFESGRLPSKVVDAVFSLPVDSISEPVRFDYGIHIFKVTEKKPLPSYEEMEKDVKDLYQRNYYQTDYAKYVEVLKRRYRVTIDSAAVNHLTHSLDTTKTPVFEKWDDTLTSEMLKTPLITTTEHPFTGRNFVEKINGDNEYSNTLLTSANVWKIVNKLVDIVAIEEEARHAIGRYPKIAKLMKDYEDGILLFRVEQDEVWKKIVVNDSLLKDYYENHKEMYRWPERVNFAEIFTLSDSAAKAAYWQVQYGEDFTEVAQKCTNRQGYREKKGIWGFQPFTQNELARRASLIAVDSVTAPFRFEGGWSIVKALGRDSARIKTYEEASPEVASGYQEAASKQREQEWIDILKQKYPVTIKKETLTEAFKRKRVESE